LIRINYTFFSFLHCKESGFKLPDEFDMLPTRFEILTIFIRNNQQTDFYESPGECKMRNQNKTAYTLRRLVIALAGVFLIANCPYGAESAPIARTLSGAWKLATDPQNVGRSERWFESVRAEAQDAPVPGIIQQVFPAYHGVAWYWHSFDLSGGGLNGGRALIRFGAVDYLADVWLNGAYLGAYEGGETPFEFDVTDSLKTNGSNLLAVRVLNPTLEPIDGVALNQTPHRNRYIPPRCGGSFNSGGIMYPVELRTVPPVYITDLFVRPDWKTGAIAATVSVRNTGVDAVNGTLSLTVAPAAGGDILQVAEQPIEFPAGASERECSVQIAQPRLWSLEDPFLYRVTATATAARSAH
jgi:beta-galactosidase/beta-glucuronidase